MSQHKPIKGINEATDELIELEKYQINPKTYLWTFRVMNLLFRMSRLKLNVHGDQTLWRQGDIYLFNHFARFETFIPQHIIYKQTGKFTRSIAGKELFKANDRFAQTLLELGAVPTDAKHLKLLVSSEIFHGRKLLAFPEGGIVKDRLSLNDKGEYQVFSRASGERRKHHSGPAVVALAVTIFKETILKSYKNKQFEQLAQWAEELNMDNVESLLQAARRPTRIIPCNITFYPMRVSDNILRKGVDLFRKGISKRLTEELIVEGNILFKHTDMDIRIGEPIDVKRYWTRWESTWVNLFSSETHRSLKDIFKSTFDDEAWGGRVFQLSHRRNASKIRDQYMRSMYSLVTVNIAHVASCLIMKLIDSDIRRIEQSRFHRLIYLATKSIQSSKGIYLHNSLTDPDIYSRVVSGTSKGFEQFLRMAEEAGLIECDTQEYSFKNKLIEEHHFDEIRIENPIAVYGNEVQPIKQVAKGVDHALVKLDKLSPDELGGLLFDDALLEHRRDKQHHRQAEHRKINLQEKTTRSGAPFLLKPERENGEAVVLCHGLFASPAELRAFGERLQNLGFHVIGVRLKGHGTSPWDLKSHSWQEWLISVQRGVELACCYCSRVHLMGFSTGALLALQYASQHAPQLASISAISVPLQLKDAYLNKLVPFLHGANQISKALLGKSGLFPFKRHQPEHPHINYSHIPLNALNEMLKLAQVCESGLKRILAPVLLMQADGDPVVDASSLPRIKAGLTNTRVEVVWVDSGRHGIVLENTGQCQSRIIDFMLRNHLNRV